MQATLRRSIERKLTRGRLGPVVYRARELAHRQRRPVLSAADEAIVESIRTTGAYVTSLDALALAGNGPLLEEVRRIVPTLPSAESHHAIGDPNVGRNTFLHCFSVDPPELARRCPSVLLWGLEERVLDIVEAYIGVPVAFTTVHLRKDVGNGRQVGTRIWHLDTEDQRVLRVLVYLNDVTDDGGPFEFIPKALATACAPLEDRALRAEGDPILDDEMARHVPRSAWQPCTGPLGTVVLADNAAVYHHGKVHDGERIALIYTYTSRHPHYPELERNTSFDDRLSPRQRACFFVRT